MEPLTVAEGATLAALARGPSVYAPRRHPDRALARRNLVLAVMAREHYLSDSAAARARATPLRLSPGEWRPREDRSFALDAVRAVVDSVLGDAPGRRPHRVHHARRAGAARRRARRAAPGGRDRPRQRAARRSTGKSARRDTLQGALVALDPRNGELRALVGGRRYVPGGFNRALVARRQPGSAFKPFVYAAALAGGMTPAAVIMDTPVEITERGQHLAPANFDGEYAGRLTLRRALMRSANAATVRLGEAVGERRVAALARRAGIRSPLDAGAGARARRRRGDAARAGDGVRAVRQRRPPGDSRRSCAASRRATAPCSGARRPARPSGCSARRRRSSSRRCCSRWWMAGPAGVVRDRGVTGAVAGKTGTTNDGTDVWFVGYTPTVVAAVWFGYDAPRPIAPAASGGRLAAPAWAAFYLDGWRERDAADWWPAPAGMVSRTIDAFNGDLANRVVPRHPARVVPRRHRAHAHCREHSAPLVDRLEEFGRKVGQAVKDLLGLVARLRSPDPSRSSPAL